MEVSIWGNLRSLIMHVLETGYWYLSVLVVDTCLKFQHMWVLHDMNDHIVVAVGFAVMSTMGSLVTPPDCG